MAKQAHVSYTHDSRLQMLPTRLSPGRWAEWRTGDGEGKMDNEHITTQAYNYRLGEEKKGVL